MTQKRQKKLCEWKKGINYNNNNDNNNKTDNGRIHMAIHRKHQMNAIAVYSYILIKIISGF